VRSQEHVATASKHYVREWSYLPLNIIDEKRRTELYRELRTWQAEQEKAKRPNLVITHWFAKVMSLHAIYIACYRFDDFKSFQGQICRGYTVAAKLERHLTPFQLFFNQMTASKLNTWQYKYTLLFLSSHLLFSRSLQPRYFATF